MMNSTSAVGLPATANQASKIIKVSLLDTMRFEYDQDLNISNGEIITFEVTNKGAIQHEFSIGDQVEQKTHAEMMMKMPGMVHEDGNSITVVAGETKKITWKFIGDEQVVFACNIPGHYQAGMFTKVDISAEEMAKL